MRFELGMFLDEIEKCSGRGGGCGWGWFVVNVVYVVIVLGKEGLVLVFWWC